MMMVIHTEGNVAWSMGEKHQLVYKDNRDQDCVRGLVSHVKV